MTDISASTPKFQRPAGDLRPAGGSSGVGGVGVRLVAVLVGSILVLFASLLMIRTEPGTTRRKSMTTEILGTIWLTSLLILLASGWIMWIQAHAFAG